MRYKLFLILLLIIILMISCSCNSNNIESDYEEEYIDPDEIEETYDEDILMILEMDHLDSDTKDIVKISSDLDLENSVYDKIYLDYLDGKIDRKQQVLLTLQAVLSPDDLADEYSGIKYLYGKVSLMDELQWLTLNYEELDLETKESLLPLYLPPKDKGSYFHPSFDSKVSFPQNISLVKKVYASDADWSKKQVPISGTSVKAEIYFNETGLSAEKKLELEMVVLDVENAVKKSWVKFRELLGDEPLDDVEIYITDKLSNDIFGSARFHIKNGNISGYEILLNDDFSGPSIKSTTAHELFHCFQFALGMTWYTENPELLWLMEATAVWSEDYVQQDLYPDYNSEHIYLKEFFRNLNSDRLSTLGTREYGSYMLFYFLSERYGSSIISEVLHAASDQYDSMDIRGMLMDKMEIETLKDLYGEFALYNWNRSPFKKYTDQPSFPDTMPKGQSVELHKIESFGERETGVSISRGGIIYQLFVFKGPPEDIPWIRFDFINKIPQSNDVEYVKRQAIIKVGDTWSSEDWTQLEHRDFCRTNDEDNVELIALIHSNPSLIDTVEYNYNVKADPSCPLKGKGFINIDYEMIVGQEDLQITDNFSLNSKDELIYCPDSDSFLINKREVTFNSSSSSKITNPFSEQGDMITQKSIGSGSISEEYDENDSVWRLAFDDDNNVTINYFPDAQTSEWITYTHSGVREYVEKKDFPPVSRGHITLESGEKTFTTQTGEKISQIVQIGDKKIYARFTIEKMVDFGKGIYTVELEYVLTDDFIR